MFLTPGSRLGSYEILAPLGAGGMGEVYRARDGKLGRDVAIKILPEHFSRHPERLVRFDREARALAALNHPNIAAIYSFEQSSDVPFLVLEYVPGETVKGPLPVPEALAVGRQICEALEAAHNAGIVHRDLKTGNIKVTSDGKVKVLDFGLAKAASFDSAVPQDAPTRTLAVPATEPGLILGTLPYMSPEQARGRPVDKRADVWAFGCVLYELLTGRSPFEGETVSDIVAAILNGEPNWEALPPATPHAIRSLLRRCLAKDPHHRLHDIADARIELEEVPAAGASAAPSPSRPRRGLYWLLAALLTGVALVLALSQFRERPAEQPLVRLPLLAPEKLTFKSIVVSPDGAQFAFTASDSAGNTQLWVRRLDSGQARLLPGTEGAIQPFWSANSSSLGFFAGGKLRKIEAAGGPPQTLCEALNSDGGAWNAENVIIFASRSLYRVSAEGGSPEKITSLDRSRQEEDQRWPAFLPDGHRFVYYSQAWGPNAAGIYLSSLDSKAPSRVAGVRSGASFVTVQGRSYLLFIRDGMLVAQPFDTARLEARGESVPLAEQVAFDVGSVRGSFSVSANGVLVYQSSTPQVAELVWFDRAGRRLGTADERGFRYNVSLSPDQKRLATERLNPGGDFDLWLVDLARGVSSRFTADSANQGVPVWSPDGREIAFFSTVSGLVNMYRKASSGAGSAELLLKSELNQVPTDWSPDGRFIAYCEYHPANGTDLWLLPAEGERKAIPILRTRFNEDLARFSPDGKWIVYQSDESGRNEVYVRPFDAARPETLQSSAVWQVSVGGGMEPRWRRDGSELFYLNPDGKLMAAAVRAQGATFQSGVPGALFATRAVGRSRYDVTADGRRFLINVPAAESFSSPASVVLNWTSALKK